MPVICENWQTEISSYTTLFKKKKKALLNNWTTIKPFLFSFLLGMFCYNYVIITGIFFSFPLSDLIFFFVFRLQLSLFISLLSLEHIIKVELFSCGILWKLLRRGWLLGNSPPFPILGISRKIGSVIICPHVNLSSSLQSVNQGNLHGSMPQYTELLLWGCNFRLLFY